MIAFHGKQEIKDQYLERVRAHRMADEIIKGKYWEKGKGCAVGCTIHGSDHSRYETELGIPRILARLEDGIFEALPNELAMTWPERFLEAITPGADLTQVWDHFALWVLADEKYGAMQFAKTEQSKKVIQTVIDLYIRKIRLENIDIKTWHAAAAVAYAEAYASAYAAYSAADAAAYSASAYAAYAAASAYAEASAYAAYAAYSAADAAAYSASAYAAYAKRIEFRISQSEKLLELLKKKFHASLFKKGCISLIIIKSMPQQLASEGDIPF